LIWWWKQQHNQPETEISWAARKRQQASFLPSFVTINEEFLHLQLGILSRFLLQITYNNPKIVAESINRCCKERLLTKRWPSRKTWTKQGNVLQATHNNGVSEPSAAALSNDDGVVGPDGTRTSCIHSRAIPVASILAMLQWWKRTCHWTSKREREEHQIRVRVSFSFLVSFFFYYFLHSFVFLFPRVPGTTKLPFLFGTFGKARKEGGRGEGSNVCRRGRAFAKRKQQQQWCCYPTIANLKPFAASLHLGASFLQFGAVA
jgi:hypothetical protein